MFAGLWIHSLKLHHLEIVQMGTLLSRGARFPECINHVSSG